MALTAILIGAAVLSAAVSAYAAVSAGEAQAQAAAYQKKVARNQAQAARDAAAVARSNREEEFRRLMGAQRARIGASGVDFEGSPLLVQMESAAQAQIELERITYAGETQSKAFQAEGILQGFYATRARQAGQLGAGSALLSGVSSAANIYARRPSTTTPTAYDYGYQSYRAGERSAY